MIPPDKAAAKKIEGIKIQQRFVEKRKKSLSKAAGRDVDLLEEVINTVYKQHYQSECLSWVDVYNRISDNLRKSDLTINLNATSWFQDANTYKAYAQMYERAVKKTTGRMGLRDDALNPADVRAAADDQATLPESWRQAPMGSGKRRIYDAMNASGSVMPSDFLTGVKTTREWEPMLGDRSDKSTLKLVDRSNGKNTFESVNKNFNPYAKQVFAALNFGRRPNGSSTQYGRSYLVLNPELKKKCLYFPRDTFYLNFIQDPKIKERLASTGRGKADMQSSYDWLGHILLWANPYMRSLFFESCYLGKPLPNTPNANELLEAHIFGDVRMDRDVAYLVLAQEERANSPEEWAEIQNHAYGWSRQHNCRVYIKSAP